MNLSLAKVRLRAPAVVFLFGVLMFAYIVLVLAAMTDGHVWGDDWAQYVLHARNIVTGHPYTDTGYLFNPDRPHVGPPSYPPGLPLLLAPILAVSGINIFAFKVVCFACAVAAFPVAFRLLSFSVSNNKAFLAVFLFALHPDVWAPREAIGSEAPYLLFSMLTLWWGARPTQPNGSWVTSAAAGILLGFLLYISVICRSIGITLLPAILVYGWAQRKPPGWFAGVVVSFMLLVWLQTHWLVMPTAYENELRMPTVGLILANANNYWLALASWVPLPFGLGRFSSAMVVVLGAIGAWIVCHQREPDAPKASTLRTLAVRVPLILLYLAAYLLALLLAAIEPDPRYLLPIMPITFALAAEGGLFIAKRLSHPRRIVLCVALSLALYWGVLSARKSDEQQATCDACMAMFSYVRAHTDQDSVIVFVKPRAMALLGGRASWRPSEKYTKDELTRKLAILGASIVVIGATGSDFAGKYPVSASLAGRISDPGAEILFRNSMFEIIRLGSSPRIQGTLTDQSHFFWKRREIS